jgi:hypothetical protein
VRLLRAPVDWLMDTPTRVTSVVSSIARSLEVNRWCDSHSVSDKELSLQFLSGNSLFSFQILSEFCLVPHECVPRVNRGYRVENSECDT